MTPPTTEQEFSVEDCQRHARAMIDSARAANTEKAKVEFLQLATEWMKLAAEIGRLRDRKN